MLIELIMEKGGKRMALTDASHCAQILYQRFKDNLSEALHLSHHGKKLINRGFVEDLAYCAQTDMTDIVPIFREGVVRIR
jgi:2-phosphosulfolactate phosphatase